VADIADLVDMKLAHIDEDRHLNIHAGMLVSSPPRRSCRAPRLWPTESAGGARDPDAAMRDPLHTYCIGRELVWFAEPLAPSMAEE